MSTADDSVSAVIAKSADHVAMEHLGKASSLVRDVMEGGHPKVIVENGIAVAAIVDAKTYDALREAAAQQLLRDLHEAIAQSEAGELVGRDEVFGELRARLRGRVSPDLQRQLDAL